MTRFLTAVIPGLLERFEITVIAPRFGPVRPEGYRLVQVPLRKGQFGDVRFASWRYNDVLREARSSDIVFTQTIGPIGACAIYAARSLRRPLVAYIHSMESELIPMAVGPTPMRSVLYKAMRWYTRLLYSRPDLLLTPSESVDDQLSWQRITTPKRVVRLGVDTARFSPGPSKPLRKTLGIGEEDIVIGQHGRLAREKDWRTTMRAFLRVQKRHPNVKLLVVADGLPEIKRLLKKPGVILVGSQDDVVPYLRAMDIFVLSSLTETTCLSALEAMACGLPVVSTPVGFVKDYITHGENGLFFPLRNAYELSQQIDWLIANPSLGRAMGERARALVVREFSWDQTVTGIVAALEDVLGG